MTKEQLERWRSLGFEFDESYNLISKEHEVKSLATENKIVGIVAQKLSDENNLTKVYQITIELNTTLTTDINLEIKVENKIYPVAIVPNSDIRKQRYYYTQVKFEIPAGQKIKEFKIIATLQDILSSTTISFKETVIKVENNKANSADEECTQCKIDIDFFISEYKKQFEKIFQSQINALNVLFEALCQYYKSENRQGNQFVLAYMLATIKHETNDSYWPIDEMGGLKYYEEMYDPVLGKNEKRKKMATDNGNTEQGDGVKYHGRGYVQLTWKNNYKKMTDKFNVDLINYPEKALQAQLAIQILIYGCEEGIFTGLKLSKFISAKSKDYYNARKVINGLDDAKLIEGYANKLEQCIKII